MFKNFHNSLNSLEY